MNAPYPAPTSEFFRRFQEAAAKCTRGVMVDYCEERAVMVEAIVKDGRIVLWLPMGPVDRAAFEARAAALEREFNQPPPGQGLQ